MGTHISRVKSVDLDSWTDEQLQSVLSWGNARANKYWEAKLAPGHVPSEAKIENFIRTKYELKRWVMEGPMPDPSTLDVEGDDDIPLSVVKEKQNIERRESVRKEFVGQSAASNSDAAPPANLFGGDPVFPRPNTTGPVATKVPPKAQPAPPKATSTKDSLLGLDFFGGESTAPPRPASSTGTPSGSGQSRPDLKQSILSLYATAPRPQQQSTSLASSGGMGALPSPTGMGQMSSVGGFNDAFSSLNIVGAAAPAPLKSPARSVDPFSGFGTLSASGPAPPENKLSKSSAFSGLSGGNFFEPKPAQGAPTHQSNPSTGSMSGFGGFVSPSMTSTVSSKAAPPPSGTSALGDLFDLSSSAPPVATPDPPALSPPASSSSVFNLSAPPSQPASATTLTPSAKPLGSVPPSSLSNSDVWGGNVWDASESVKTPVPTRPAATGASNDFGWGTAGSSSASNALDSSSLANKPIVIGHAGAPKVAADEEYGGWSSSTGPAAPSGGGGGNAKPAGEFGASEDLFSNVWQ